MAGSQQKLNIGPERTKSSARPRERRMCRPPRSRISEATRSIVQGTGDLEPPGARARDARIRDLKRPRPRGARPGSCLSRRSPGAPGTVRPCGPAPRDRHPRARPARRARTGGATGLGLRLPAPPALRRAIGDAAHDSGPNAIARDRHVTLLVRRLVGRRRIGGRRRRCGVCRCGTGAGGRRRGILGLLLILAGREREQADEG